jgi:two-component system nitrogen regulation response regulator GlnG
VSTKSNSPPSDPSTTVLVVDDEPAICWGFEKMLRAEGFDVLCASSAEQGLALTKNRQFDLVVLDVRLPGESGIQALPRFIEAVQGAPVIVMTAFGDLETAVAAIQGGAMDYLTKPFKLDDALSACRLALQKNRSASNVRTNSDEDVPSLLVGRSAVMQAVFRQIAMVAPSDLPVLITGETGTGKELVAAALHRHSRRHEYPYLPAAPATFSETVLESELFGHVKGAFTGANDDRKGLFELANRGTVLLDEIGDLPLSAQVKLLRVIEQKEFTAVGDVRPRKIDVRVLAATNRDLKQAVAEGKFREDLLYRLAAVSIHLPPLRNRVEDIPLLCQHFLARLGYPNPDQAVGPELVKQLQSRDWLGNVRELRNAVEHASVMARGRPLVLGDFPEPQLSRLDSTSAERSKGGERLETVIEAWTRENLRQSEGISDLYERFLSAVEPTMLRVVLEHTQGNRLAAAELLGMHRGTLRERMKRYGRSDAVDTTERETD